MSEKYLSVKEVAAVLSISRFQVMQAIRSGRLKACRVADRAIRIAESALSAFILASSSDQIGGQQ